MNSLFWNEHFGSAFLIHLTNEERRYLALEELSADLDVKVYYRKTNFVYTRTTAFFDKDVIVKTIGEEVRLMADGSIRQRIYCESDTRLQTSEGRSKLLPLTDRGKEKAITSGTLDAITPFGCTFTLQFTHDEPTGIYLSNLRACRRFPIAINDDAPEIVSEESFHRFMQGYIETCTDSYFQTLNAFKNAKKVTVKYRTGDIFRMHHDRTHYTYGLIVGQVKEFKAMPEFPREGHSMNCLMTVPILVRMYDLLTERDNLTAKDFEGVPLGRMDICSDNDIIWGTHTITDHKTLCEDDLEFHLVCVKKYDKSGILELANNALPSGERVRLQDRKFTLSIEWGFAQTTLSDDQLTDKLKTFFKDYRSPHGGVLCGISPYLALPSPDRSKNTHYRNNLLEPHLKEIKEELFLCLGLKKDSTFDDFAECFGGLTLTQFTRRLNAKGSRKKS